MTTNEANYFATRELLERLKSRVFGEIASGKIDAGDLAKMLGQIVPPTTEELNGDFLEDKPLLTLPLSGEDQVLDQANNEPYFYAANLSVPMEMDSVTLDESQACGIEVLPDSLLADKCTLRLVGEPLLVGNITIQRADEVTLNTPFAFDDSGFASLQGGQATIFLRPASSITVTHRREKHNTASYEVDGEEPKSHADELTWANTLKRSVFGVWDHTMRTHRLGQIPLDWLEFAEIDALESWCLSSENSYPQVALGTGFHGIYVPILRHILRRRVLEWRSGERSALLRFWNSVCKALRFPNEVATAFESIDLVETIDNSIGVANTTEIRETDSPANIELLSRTVDEENAFAEILEQLAMRLNEVTKAGYPTLGFFADELCEIAKSRRKPRPDSLYTPYFHAPMLWNTPPSLSNSESCLRSGILLPMILTRRDSSTCNPLLTLEVESAGDKPSAVSSELDFTQAIDEIRTELGSERWYPLEIPHGWSNLQIENLSGRSGTMVTLVSQRLAQPDNWGNAYALPPYLSICVATAGRSEYRAQPVGGLKQKVELLKEYGTRILIVHDSQLSIAKTLAPASMHVIGHEGGVDSLIELLKRRCLVWPVNVSHLQPNGCASTQRLTLPRPTKSQLSTPRTIHPIIQRFFGHLINCQKSICSFGS